MTQEIVLQNNKRLCECGCGQEILELISKHRGESKQAAIATVVGNFNRKVYQLINNSPRYNTTVFKVDVGENMFSWLNKQGSVQYGYSIENILDKYGYTGDHDPKKPRSRKPNSIIMVNLISPKLEYKDLWQDFY